MILMFSLHTIGKDNIKILNNAEILNQGSSGFCGGNKTLGYNAYCEFESYFKRDLSYSLSIHEEQIDVLFVKPFSEDSVKVTFRFISQNLLGNRNVQRGNNTWINEVANTLSEQVSIQSQYMIIFHLLYLIWQV